MKHLPCLLLLGVVVATASGLLSSCGGRKTPWLEGDGDPDGFNADAALQDALLDSHFDADEGESDVLHLDCEIDLPSARLAGETPAGHIELELTGLTMADCCENGDAVFTFGAADGTRAMLSFRYDAQCVPGGTERFLAPEGIEPSVTLSFPSTGDHWSLALDVEITHWRWSSSPSGHQISAVLRVTGTGFDLEPIELEGTYGEWSLRLC